MTRGDEALLLADIGGTKTDIVQVVVRVHGLVSGKVASFHNRDYESAESVLDEYVDALENRPHYGCIAVAGPVAGGRTRLTNLPWELDESRLAERYSLRQLRLVNDVHALGYLVPHLREDDVTTLVERMSTPGGIALIISPGTGLGVSLVLDAESGYRAFPSEAGNSRFAPATEEQLELLRFGRREVRCVRVEDLCSGPGIERIHRFLCECRASDLTDTDKKILTLPTALRTQQIVASALSDEETKLCCEALRLFVEILANVCQDFALSFMVTGGIYIAGRLPLTLRPLLVDSFEKVFAQSDRAQALTVDVPVRLITKPFPVLHGAYWHALQALALSP